MVIKQDHFLFAKKKIYSNVGFHATIKLRIKTIVPTITDGMTEVRLSKTKPLRSF